MGDVVARQALEVFAGQPMFVSHFDAIGPALGKPGKKAVERGNELAALLVVGGVESGELENKDAHLAAN